jgi:glycosyltransferase involved in cell wall biosynthesis
MKRVVFWQNILSPHQSPAMRALAEIIPEVVVVSADTLTADRIKMGWQIPDLGAAQVVIAPNAAKIESLVRESAAHSVHIVAGARWTPLGHAATRACIHNRVRLGIMSESADNRGIRGSARRIKYTFERFSTGRYFDFILAIGHSGMKWFKQCGYRQDRLFPYAYFTELSVINKLSVPKREDAGIRIIYLGRCVSGKGLPIFFEALSRCKDAYWTLIVVGDGPVRDRLEAQASKYALSDRIQFISYQEHGLAQKLLSCSDLLVLPSDGKEGWGAVVNEALMHGVPAICSDRCGAADLLRDSWRGGVFPSGSISGLASLLREWITRGRPSLESTERIKSWSRYITGESAAIYLQAILAHIYEGSTRPVAPWF